MLKLFTPASVALSIAFMTGCSTPVIEDTTLDKVEPTVVNTVVKPGGKSQKISLEDEKIVYPDSSHTSFLGEEKQLKLIYGVQNSKAFYKIKNNSQDGFLVTVKFDDGTEARHEVNSYSMSEVINFPISESIENWEMKSWTTREKFDEAQSGGIRFAWRTFKGESQFRLHSSNETYTDVTYYYENNPEVKSTIKVMPKGASNWVSYKGGNIVTSFK